MPHDPSDPRETNTLAREPLDDHDAQVLAVLRRAAEHLDPVPHGLVDRITFAVALDEVYAEVAEIQRGARQLTGVRGDPSDTSSLTFTGDDLTVTITVTPADRGHVRIDGWITPPCAGTVVLRLADQTRRDEAAGGRFWFDDVPHGYVQLLVEGDHPDQDARLVTPAVEL